MDQEAILLEIEESVQDALGRCGAAGTVHVAVDLVRLEGHGPTTTTSLDTLVAAWKHLCPDARRQRCNALARRLVSQRRSMTVRPQPPRSASLGWILVVAALVIAGLGIGLAHVRLSPSNRPRPRSLGDARRPSPRLTSADEQERARALRAAQVCDRTQTRVVRGATVGPTDVEGWVVELALVRVSESPWLGDPALTDFIHRTPGDAFGRLVGKSAPTLANLSGPSTKVALNEAEFGGTPPIRTLKLTFSGRYVTPYFTENQRPQYFELASTLARELDAAYAGVYARCVDQTTPHLGSWFRGPHPAGAAAALLYFMGSDATTPHVAAAPPGTKGDWDRADPLRQLEAATSRLSRKRIARLIGAHGGMVAGRPKSATVLLFPFRDGNRAARSSLELARALKITPTP